MAIVFKDCVAEGNGGGGFHIRNSLQGRQADFVFMRTTARRNGGDGFLFSLDDRERFAVPAAVSNDDALKAAEIARSDPPDIARSKIATIGSWAMLGVDRALKIEKFIERVLFWAAG